MNLDKMKRYTETIDGWVANPAPLVNELLSILPDNDTRKYVVLNLLLCMGVDPKLSQGIVIGMLLMNMIHMDTIAERESKDLERMLGEMKSEFNG
jgi:hypothetical protein